MRKPRKGSLLESLLQLPEDLVVQAVRESRSVRDCLRRLGFSGSSSAYQTFYKFADRLGLDTGHFRGQQWLRGQKLFDPHSVLIKSTGTKKAHALRRALLEIGREYHCEGLAEHHQTCSVGSIWNGRPINLQVDHVNGDKTDNRPHNLRFLCLNCHSQTVTFGYTKEGKKFREMLQMFDVIKSSFAESNDDPYESPRMETTKVYLVNYYLNRLKSGELKGE